MNDQTVEFNGFCPNCGQRAKARLADFGIGTYEFWGHKGVDRREAWICTRCECILDVEHLPKSPCEYCKNFSEDEHNNKLICLKLDVQPPIYESCEQFDSVYEPDDEYDYEFIREWKTKLWRPDRQSEIMCPSCSEHVGHTVVQEVFRSDDEDYLIEICPHCGDIIED